MEKRNITIIISIIGVIVFIAAVASVSYAYYTSNITTSGENETNVTTATISADFKGGADFEFLQMIPGNSFSKSFSLENTGTAPIYYKITMKDIKNTFERTQDITYILTENGQEIARGTFPTATSAALSNKLNITKDEIKNYVLTVTYENVNVNQKDDMNKEISGSIFIEEVDNN